MAFTTSLSVLSRVRAGNEVGWREFYETYRPLIMLVGRDCSLRPDENEDLVQQVMSELFTKNIIGKYDPDHIPDDVTFHYDTEKQGRFRHYLKAIVRNQAIKIYHKRFDPVPEPDVPEPGHDPFDKVWGKEWRKHVLNMALVELRGRVEPKTYSAFEMYALHKRKLSEVCKFQNMSESSVYTAKSRCIATLREIIKNLEKE